MARKKHYKRSQPMPPKAAGSVWEIGCQPLVVAPSDVEPQDDQPALLLIVDVSIPSRIVFSGPVMSRDASDILVQRVQHAMHHPLVGEPRRPECLRVRSEWDADCLRIMADTAGIALEVVPELTALDALHAEFTQALGGIEGSYRIRAGQVGESFNEEGLRELFRVAARFYREESWWLADDTELFKFEFDAVTPAASGGDPPHHGNNVLYGILMGHEGEEYGMALYTSLEDIEQVYELDIDRLEQDSVPFEDEEFEDMDIEEAPMASSQSLSIPCLGLTFRPESDLSDWLVAEVQELNLPIATNEAFPLVMRIGEGHMQLATPSEWQEMLIALEALLGWEEELDKLDGSEEEDHVPMTVRLEAIEGVRPDMWVRVTLMNNPYAPEGEFGELDDLEPFSAFDEDEEIGFRDMQVVVDQLLVQFPELDKLNSLSDSGKQESSPDPEGGDR